jgi:exodeoxyribonuclease VII small subunit
MSNEASETADATIDSLSFDEAVAELTRTVAELEAGGLPLERSLALYERGVALHERCASLLGQAELRVQRLLDRASGALEVVEARPGEAGEE